MIEYAVRNHFPDFSEKDLRTGYEYSQRYLEKLIQIPFRIPALGEIESGMYITLLLIGSVLKDDDVDFKKLLCLAIEKMKTPWENTGFTISELQKTLGEAKFASIVAQFTIANQISDILARNTQGNPRKIKRFINMLLLRKKIAESRGFGDTVDISILAKMMLAEHFFNVHYKRIACLTNDEGKCDILEQYETLLLNNPDLKRKESTEPIIALAVERNASPKNVGKDDENPDINEWEKDIGFTEWAKTSPRLGNIDLRPYFFASKEKEDFFFDQIKSEVLRELINKLMGKTMVIASINEEIKNLSVTEAKTAFEIIGSKILKTTDMSIQPAGIDGLRAMTEHHPTLEPMLLSFIEALHGYSKVGIWVQKGWEKTIKSTDGKAKLQAHIAKIKEKNSSPTKAKSKKGGG